MTQEPGLIISSDVLYGIVQVALEDVDGISCSLPPATVGEFLGGRKSRSIEVERREEEVWVDLTVAVTFGKVIPDVARQAQRAVREALISMTNLKVASVNVSVEGVELAEGALTSG